MPADATTVVRGDPQAPLCNASRTWLHFYVYAKDAAGSGSSPAKPASPSKEEVPAQFHKQVFTDTLRMWEMTDQVVKDDESGLKAQRWDAKDRHKGHVSVCEPTVVYRGSRMVFTDIAIETKVTIYGVATLHLVLTPADGGAKTTYKGSIAGVQVAHGGREPDEQIAEFKQARWEETKLIDDTATVWVPGATDWIKAPVRVSLQSTVWAGQDGDWANNINQGLGKYSQIYQDALKFARKQVENVLSSGEYKPPRIFFTGHSLGGGLASAAAEQMHFEYSRFPKLYIRGLNYNSAGLNQRTLSPGAGLRAAPVSDYTVRDEILTTLQSRGNEMPMVVDFFRIAGKLLAPAVTNILFYQGKNPGSAGYTQFGKQGSNLPVLFPLEKQTLIASRVLAHPTDKLATKWPALAILDQALKGQTVLEVAQSLITILHDQYYEDAVAAGNSWIWDIYKYEASEAFKTLGPELADLGKIMAAATQYHLLPAVAETFAHVARA